MIPSTIEIILKDDVQKIFDAFSASFNMRIGFLSTDGKELAVGLSKPCNEFCEIVRNALDKKKKCLTLDEKKRKEALIEKDLLTWHCYAGMIESIIPIYYDGIHLGFFMMGQYRNEKKLDRLLLQEYELKFGSVEKLVISYLKTPSFSEDQINNIQNLFRLIVDYIVSQNLITLKSNLVVEKIITYARNQPEKHLSIREASELVGKSISTVSHIFTDILHKSFKKVMIEIKLEKAEKYLSLDPDMNVREAAFLVGYDDPYYFSRLYKIYRGISPSKYRDSRLLEK
ncbi:MAG: helix-turn-helix domain-containing protein [Spirochaetales bacterium]|nr:MAG: helix-turn-helix domain-containing protein [Spirochaetales bacterium]